jgi:hypothetical protein
MSHWDENRVPSGLEDVEQRLREYRPEVSALDLDRIKLQARSRASALRPKGSALRSRLVIGLVTLGLLVGGTGSVIANSDEGGGGGGGDNGDHQKGGDEGSAANKQYCDRGSHRSQCQQQGSHGSGDRGGGGGDRNGRGD